MWFLTYFRFKKTSLVNFPSFDWLSFFFFRRGSDSFMSKSIRSDLTDLKVFLNVVRSCINWICFTSQTTLTYCCCSVFSVTFCSCRCIIRLFNSRTRTVFFSRSLSSSKRKQIRSQVLQTSETELFQIWAWSQILSLWGWSQADRLVSMETGLALFRREVLLRTKKIPWEQMTDKQ